MLDTRRKMVSVKPGGGHSAGNVEVTYHPSGAFRGEPAHFWVVAGPGATNLSVDGLDELIADLQALRELTRQQLSDERNSQ